jgi:signal peptidase II
MDTATEMSATAPTAARTWNGGKLGLFAAVLFGVVAVDLATKRLIESSFHLYQQMNIIGDYVRLTYIHNPGAAFGIQIGPPGYSRFIFLGLSIIALIALAGMYWVTPLKDRVRLTAIALICAGAVGNLLDRIRNPAGVVDFLDVGFNDLRWPVFNVADIAVTTGAIFLALSLWREEQHPEAKE